MKKFLQFLTLTVLAVSAVSCNTPEGPVEKAPIKVLEGNVSLEDMEFGMYYGTIRKDEPSVYRVVLSDAVCFRDGYGEPYLDSEGDMLVLEFKAKQDSEAPIMIPEGTYVVDATKSGDHTINVANSYVKRLIGSTQYHYELLGGTIDVGSNLDGGYDIITDLVIAKGSEQFSVKYSYNGNIKFEDWNRVAASLQTIKDDIIDIPFADVTADYYGNLFGYDTGNYVISLSTAGFMEDETGTVPGVALILNMFGELVGSTEVILLEEGTYTVYPSFNYKEFSMLYGLNMDGMPFGTYIGQIDGNLDQALDFINSGTVEVTRESHNYEDVYTLKYDLSTSARKIQGTWVGALEFNNLAENSGRVVLSTLDDDVECDMHRIEMGYLHHLETLMTTPQPSVDIAEAWQLWLEPRMWTDEEKKLPWDERIEAWDPNGDVMILEFVIPLGSEGNIAPEINKEYTYRIQPNLAMDDPLYVVSVSKMGRPYDDIFYEPNWKDYTYMTGTDARRGFTWAGGFRGNWYLHYIEGTYQNMDEYAPAVKGTVTVTRLTDLKQAGVGSKVADFKFVWDLYDDSDASYNITGEWTGPVTVHTSAEL